MNQSKTYCNPLSLENYQPGRACSSPKYTGKHFREMADPTVIFFQGCWYLFPSAGMLWYSEDFINWKYHPITPFDTGYAPTVVVAKGSLYMTASWDQGSAIWKASHPLGPWKRLGEKGKDSDNNDCWLRDHTGTPARWGDPCLFCDDDGQLYCYFNFDRETRPEDNHPWNRYPESGVIFGVRLCDDDPTRFAHAPVPLIRFDPTLRWQCLGEYNQRTDSPVLEGPWMNKINGRYYLQYSVNGTEYRNYAIACSTADNPLGPFTMQKRNPILLHRGGLVNGCAHHSIVEGPHSSLWCFYTTLFRIHHRYERRIGMDPAGIDQNGELFINGPTETPQHAPGVFDTTQTTNGCDLVPLSVNCSVHASSFREGREPMYAIDEHIRTWWQPAEPELPQWIEVDLEGLFTVHSARTIFGDCGLDYSKGIVPGPYCYRISGLMENGTWAMLCDESENTTDRHIAYDTWSPTKIRAVRLTILKLPHGMQASVLEFTVFGERQK